MSTYNSSVSASVTVTFTGGTDPIIATDPTSGLPMSYNVTSVVRKPGEPVGIYIVTLSESIGAMTMLPVCSVWCEADGKAATVHPTIGIDGLVSVLEVRGVYVEGGGVGTLADIMFILRIESQWLS